MLSRVGRAWRSWRAKARLLAPVQLMAPGSFPSPVLHFAELDDRTNGRPNLPAYQGLAEFWHEHVRFFQPDYTSYLQHLARERGTAPESVLDLACGAGTLTERLAAVVPDVVGLDLSEPMLARARERCAGLPGVALHRADFRTFDLGRRFDAVVCAGDSLNYLDTIDELATVLNRVADHLRPGGVFVFDTVTELGMKAMSGMHVHSEVDGRRFVVRFSYDPARRAESSAALLAEGVEWHRRVPINPADVVAAAVGSGLRVDDYFSSDLIPGTWDVGGLCFFVLSRE